VDWKQIVDLATVLATIGGGVFALITLFQGLVEYIRQGSQKRAELFMEMRRRLKENESFKEILALLEKDEPALEAIPFKDKRDLLGFFEEIALMTHSGLIRKEVAGYMFGYYAIRCWESEHFWNNIMRWHDAWSLFRDFVEQMTALEKSFKYERRKFRL
jgi:hypothetical protein